MSCHGLVLHYFRNFSSSKYLHGNRKAPPPFSSAVKGNLHTLPSPTDRAIQDSKNSMSFVQTSRFDDGVVIF